MKLNLLFCSSILLLTANTHAGPVITVGNPGDAEMKPPTLPSPNLGGIFINFDSLTTPLSCVNAFVGCPAFTANTYAAQDVSSISSQDGLLVIPFSTQSGPNELFDNGSNGIANIVIALAKGTTAIGIGIADSDLTSVTFQALGANGVALGAPFTENLATTESLVNTGNGYYVVSDITADIFGLQITQTTANPNFSGLAIDDLQVATPEPSTFVMLGAGALLLGVSRIRKQS